MSYEGYVQQLCENGHYDQHNCHTPSEVCWLCGAPIVFNNPVDQTNGDEHGWIPMDLLVHLPNECIHKLEEKDGQFITTRITKHGVYCIPTEEEAKKLRTYRDWETNKIKFEHSGEVYEPPK